VTSGYFNPIHIGHIRMLRAARELTDPGLGDRVLVIVNNDAQQLLKKGQIIIPEDQRLEVVKAVRYVDDAVVAVDSDSTVCATLAQIAADHEGYRIVFGNGGDRDSSAVVPEEDVCRKHGIEMVFGLGGTDKPQSSSEINRARGIEA
jgi:cytidyltransferase-like protein